MKKSLFILLLAACGLHLQAQDQLIQVARGYLQNGNYEKAAATFKQLVEYNPKDVELQADYARSLLGLKDYKNAEKAVKQWLKKDPDRVEANFQLFRVYKGSEENRKAEKLFSRLLDHVPDLEEVIRSTSVMFEKENYFTEATAIYEKGRTYHK